MGELCFYERIDEDRYRPTEHAQGAWRAHEQHMSPVAGLLAHVLEREPARPDLQLARISYDILGLIPMKDSVVTVRAVRPGRTVELLEVTLSVAGRAVVRADAWRLSRHDTAGVAGGCPPSLAARRTMARWRASDVWDGGYIASLQIHRAEDAGPGRAQAWLRSDVQVVAGEPSTATASFLRLVDTANGVAVRASPREWMFPNVDLTVHLFRQPAGDWLGLDTTVTFGGGGLGLTSSWLHDEQGPVGRAEQVLTVRPMPKSGVSA